MHHLRSFLSRTISMLAATVAVIALLSPISAAQSYVFNEVLSATGNNPQAMTFADVNGDGRTDLIVANYNDNTVSVYLGNTVGTYFTAVTYATGPNPTAVLVADFNSDGKLDLAVVDNNCPSSPCNAPGSVSILLGNGDGTFQAPINTTVGNSPFGIATADYNGDKKPDLVVSNRADNTVSLLIGNGDGTFFTHKVLPVGNNPAGVSSMDVNQDKLPDITVANTNDSTVSLYVNHGAGNFGSQNTYLTGSGPVGVAVGDFNSDKIPDLVTANTGAPTVSVLVSKGSAGNGFNPHVDFTVAGPVTSVFVDDVNSDTFSDIVAASTTGNTFSVLLGSGTVSFQNHIDFATGNGPSAIIATDLTGDNFQDVAVVNAVDNTLAIYPGWNTGAFQVRLDNTTGNQPGAIATADFNGDGITDMAIVNRGDNDVEIFLGNGNGTFTAVPNPPATGMNPSWVAAADFNNDGRQDLVVTNAVSNTITILLGNGDGTFSAGSTINVGKNPVSVAAADFTGDNIPDLAVINQNDASMSVFQNNGSGGFTLLKVYTTGKGSTPGQVVASDLIGNGDTDLVVATGATNGVAVYFGFQNGTFTSPIVYTVGTNPMSVAVADMNNDGIKDIVTGNNGSNNVSVLLGTGKGKFNTTASNFPTAISPYEIAVQDFNSDGKLDVAVASSSPSSNRLSILLGNGDGTLQLNVDHATKFTAKGLGEGLAAADFNGDGAYDLALTDQFSTNASVFLNSPVPVFYLGGTLNFGGVNVGTQSNPIAELLTNSGSAPLNNLVISTSPPFSETTTCGSSLAVGANCTATVTFTPTHNGMVNGSLNFADDAPTSPQVLPLNGSGNGPVVQLSVTMLTFPVTIIGQNSPKQQVTMTNIGNETLNISSIVTSPSVFKQTTTCGATLGAGLSCLITVQFQPTMPGPITGTVSITDNAPGSPQMIMLSGTGTAVKLTPTSLAFGNQTVGTKSSAMNVTVMNVGSSSFNFTSFMIGGSNPGDFSISSMSCSTSTPLGAGARCSISVVFMPTMTGSRSATLLISDTGGGSPQSVALTGTGI